MSNKMYLKLLLLGLTFELIMGQDMKLLENLDEKIEAWKNQTAQTQQVKSWGTTSCKPIINLIEIVIRVLISLLKAIVQLVDQLLSMISPNDPLRDVLEICRNQGLLGVTIILLQLLMSYW